MILATEAQRARRNIIAGLGSGLPSHGAGASTLLGSRMGAVKFKGGVNISTKFSASSVPLWQKAFINGRI